MTHHRHHLHISPERLTAIATTVTAIAAAYIYFLIFAGYAFFDYTRGFVSGAQLKLLMALLGLGGVGGSLAAARWFDATRGPRPLTAGFAGCALAGALTLIAGNVYLAGLAAVLVGAGLAWTTVRLALALRPTLHLHRLGLCCGLGTGLAYAFCNQPPVFTAAPRVQIIIAIAAAVLGAAASLKLRTEPSKPSTSLEYRPVLTVLWVLLFLALVWLDSAAFSLIQHNPYLRADTWQGTLVLEGNAFVHFCIAALAGLAMDRHQQPLAVGTAFVGLLTACLLLGGADRYFPTARIFYTAAVSIYSTALVYFAARGGRPWLAGCLFAVAGWLGSVAGIGMAQSLHEIPPGFVAIAALVAVGAFIARHFWLRHTRAALLGFVLLGCALSQPAPAGAEQSPPPAVSA